MTGLTPAALSVKAETSLLIAPQLGIVSLGKECPNIIKNTGIGGWITPWCPPNWTLVNIDQSFNILYPGDTLELSGLFRVIVKPLR